MISYRYLKNAFYVYSSWFQRETKKPGCKIPETLLKYPSVFEEQNFCTTCTCKFSCRYDTFGELKFDTIKQNN